MATSLRKLIASPAGYSAALAVGLLVTLPSLDMGFVLDDYAHLALVESSYPLNAGTFDLYSFLGDLPLDPWWKHPDFKISMWRPLTSALLRFDNHLFGHDPVGYHVHSILWYLGILVACGLIYRRILPRGVAVLALVVFGLDECHLLTVGWIANRHAMVAMLPALLGVYAHLRWREDGWRPGLYLSILGYLVALMGGETTLSIMVYAFTYEVFAAEGTWRNRLVGLLPLGVVGASYTVFYKLMGLGSVNQGYYIDPVREPLAFLLGAATNIPVLLAASLAGFTSDISYFFPALRPIQITVGLIALIFFVALLRAVWRELEETQRRALRWILPGAVLSLLPVAVAEPFDRMLLAPMFGGAALIAVVLAGCWQLWRRSSGPEWRRRAAAAATVLLALFHLALPAFSRLAGQRITARQWVTLSEDAGQIPVEVSPEAPKDVVLLNAPDIVIGGFFPLMHVVQGKTPFRSWDNLTLGSYELVVTRTGPRTLEVEVVGAQLFSTAPERLHNPQGTRLLRGDTRTGKTFEVEILADNGLGPTKVAFRFDRDLEDSSLAILAWGTEGLVPAEFAADGVTLHLPPAPGAVPLGLKGLAPAWMW